MRYMIKVEKTEPETPHVIRVKWVDGMRFVATDSAGHSIVLDSTKTAGGEGSGFTPMQLLLAALGSCTGIDIVDILRKERQQIDDVEIIVTGQRVKEPPRMYSEIHVEYKIRGRDVSEKAVQRAIQLSEEKYCSVEAMLKAKAKVSSSYVIQ